MVDIGYKIREARKQEGMSQVGLAEYFAISREHMCQIEKGKSVCMTAFYLKLHNYLEYECSTCYLDDGSLFMGH